MPAMIEKWTRIVRITEQQPCVQLAYSASHSLGSSTQTGEALLASGHQPKQELDCG